MIIPEYRYQELVTPYAWAYILKQFSLRSEVKLEQKERLYGQLQQAKAKHILKLREVNHENLFVAEAVSDRWKINTVRTSHRLFDDTGISETQSSVCSIICTPKRVRKISQSTKYRETQILLQQMASLASEATGGEYQQRLDVIQSITNFWSHGKKCMVLEVLESDSVESTSSSGNEHEQTDVHVNEDIEDINDDINVTDNKENDTDNVHIFENSRKLVSQEEERDTAQQEEHLLDSSCCGSRVSHILLPPNMKKRGRPKGLTQTVIGLPKKRTRKSNCVPFHKKSSKEIGFLLLDWFVGSDLAKNAVNNNILITEEQVEARPELLTASCLDSIVNIDLIKKYCQKDAWEAIKSVYKEKKKNPIYICTHDADSKEASVMCSSCLEWQHLSCARLKQLPKAKNWFCNNCKC
ncbi:unnamed protein product [Mytilus edulis]|uniref:Zinc finger PHD-type domain-containing protein n=1 Tax=Mytilus edulis TaxID=6550 RepID=A0A8S3SLJ6_MYTED|nr:unnamed protein product [Mytilus edulis]